MEGLFVFGAFVFVVYCAYRFIYKRHYRQALWVGYRAGYSTLEDVDAPEYLEGWMERHMIKSAASTTLGHGIAGIENMGLALAAVVRLKEIQIGAATSMTAAKLVELYETASENQAILERDIRGRMDRTGDVGYVEKLAATGEY